MPIIIIKKTFSYLNKQPIKLLFSLLENLLHSVDSL